MKDIEVKEFEWYLCDHFFRQSNQGSRQQFQKERLAKEMEEELDDIRGSKSIYR